MIGTNLEMKNQEKQIEPENKTNEETSTKNNNIQNAFFPLESDKRIIDEIRDFFLPGNMERKGRTVSEYVLSLLKWIVVSIVTGLITGIVGVLFHASVQYANLLREVHPWLVWLLPVGGVVIVWMYHICKLDEYTGTNLIITAIRTDEKIPFSLAPLIFISTVITNLFGGSVGREGAALQLGGTIGTKIGRLFHVGKKEISLSILCGMSGVFAALFGTPLTASFFAMEVISVGVYYHSSFVPCFITSLIAYKISLAFKMTPVAFTIRTVPDANFITILKVILLATLCAGLSIVFCQAMHYTSHVLKTLLKNDYVRALFGGLIILSMTLMIGNQDYNGTGMNIIARAIAGEAFPLAFLLKIIFTAVTIGAGFKGGEIVPAFFIGATFGCVAGRLIGLDPGFAAAIGLIAVFCGSVNCPIASIFLSYEIFGGVGLILFAVACGVSFMMSGYYGLYSSQKIMYSKLRAEYINVNAK